MGANDPRTQGGGEVVDVADEDIAPTLIFKVLERVTGGKRRKDIAVAGSIKERSPSDLRKALPSGVSRTEIL